MQPVSILYIKPKFEIDCCCIWAHSFYKWTIRLYMHTHAADRLPLNFCQLVTTDRIPSLSQRSPMALQASHTPLARHLTPPTLTVTRPLLSPSMLRHSSSHQIGTSAPTAWLRRLRQIAVTMKLQINSNPLMGTWAVAGRPQLWQKCYAQSAGQTPTSRQHRLQRWSCGKL